MPCLSMFATASVRDLRNHFPKVRKLVAAHGEVLLSENGRQRYRLLFHTETPKPTAPPVDYWARLTAYQPKPLTAAQARARHNENRGDR
jgi:antitoxin (DNA-binding transcriptional repressor) of toxin-antitoxin stability system